MHETVILEKEHNGNNWTMYQFKIRRHATWAYMENVKKEINDGASSQFTDLSYFYTDDQQIFAKLKMKEKEEGGNAAPRWKVIQPYNRNPVCMNSIYCYVYVCMDLICTLYYTCRKTTTLSY